MRTVERLCALLDADTARALEENAHALREVRLRAGGPVRLVLNGTSLAAGPPVSRDALQRILAGLVDYSLYAREEELRQGYFTLSDGCRVGVCGRMVCEDDKPARMGEVGSMCVRLCREYPGCADALYRHVTEGGAIRSTLILSPPGMGKTTMLRDLIRRLSGDGVCVGVADERRELAACVNGVPTLDVGPETDVMDGVPKRWAVMMMIRAMSPRAVAADEIGGEGDAEALCEAVRCGVAVLSTAHARDVADAMARPGLRQMIESGVFRLAAVLGDRPGHVREIVALNPQGGDMRFDENGAGAVRGNGLRAVRAVHGLVETAAGGAVG